MVGHGDNDNEDRDIKITTKMTVVMKNYVYNVDDFDDDKPAVEVFPLEGGHLQREGHHCGHHGGEHQEKHAEEKHCRVVVHF